MVLKFKVVWGFLFFGVLFVYVIFEDGIDLYWVRSCVFEFLNVVVSCLFEGVVLMFGFDVMGVGWVY